MFDDPNRSVIRRQFLKGSVLSYSVTAFGWKGRAENAGSSVQPTGVA